jgi:chemotaxis protein MotA
MKAITGIGIGGAFVLLIMAVIMEGGNPMSFINIPAMMIVIGGTMMATIASTRFSNGKLAIKAVMLAIKGQDLDMGAAADKMVLLSEKARRDGLLALEDDVEALGDDFAKKGVQLVVDGADSDLVRAILQSEVDGMAERHSAVAKILSTAGGFAPTLGVLGTVMSLVHVLENLSNPGALGHSIAGAFIATLYGVGSANLVFLPIANKLKELSSDELGFRAMMLEAILSIQAGDNPRMLREKLETFLPPEQRGAAAAAAAAAKGEAPRDTDDAAIDDKEAAAA